MDQKDTLALSPRQSEEGKWVVGGGSGRVWSVVVMVLFFWLKNGRRGGEKKRKDSLTKSPARL
jgi:hypothetical protein